MVKNVVYVNAEKQVRIEKVLTVDSKDQNQKGFEAFENLDLSKSEGRKVHLISVNIDLAFTDDPKKQATYSKRMLETPQELKYDLAEAIDLR
jgi:hypothetical protein